MKSPAEPPSDPATRKEMLEINVRQKDYYESRFEAKGSDKTHEERAANKITQVWIKTMRSLISMRKTVGGDSTLETLHKQWMGDLKGQSVLDLGCFWGNPLSMTMAEQSAEYVGIDLSQQAIDVLQQKLEAAGFTHARGVAMDFLANDFAESSFDLVYAKSVIHHFKDPEIVLQEIRRILKPGGRLITFDPLQTEPMNRIARTLYRPFQSDKDWEWPFTGKTLTIIQRHFEIEHVQGFQGMIRVGYPLMILPLTRGIGRKISQWGLGFDRKRANRMGIWLRNCWQVTFCLRKPAD